MLVRQHLNNFGAEPQECELRIVIVDDDPEDRQALIDVALRANPHLNIKVFENGLELVQHLSYIKAEAFPHVLFLDLRMPIWDGIRTLRTLDTDPKYASIQKYMVSVADTEYEVSLSLRCGAKEFIVKPTVEDDWPIFNASIVRALHSAMISK